MNKLAVSALALAISCGTTFADPQGKLENGVYTIEVKEGDPDVTLNSDDVAQLGADNTLLKTGKGRLIINCDLGATYDGEIIVREGFLRATCGASSQENNRGLGKTGKGTVVKEGGTLEIIGNTNDECANGEPITFEGDGVDGCGAIYRVSGCSTAHVLFANSTITMTGNATVGSRTKGYWFRIRNTSINMNGYDLTFQNDDVANNGFKGGGGTGPVTNPGNIIVAEGAAFCLENGNAKMITGDAENKLILKANSKFIQATAIGARCGWTLQVDGAATMSLNGGVSDNGSYGWNGPIVLNDVLTITSNSSGNPFEFNGAISGTGAIAYSGAGKTLMNGDATRVHTYTGGTSFATGCDVSLAAPGLLPLTAGGVTVASGAKVLFQPQKTSDTALFTDATVGALTRALTAGGADRTDDVVIAGCDDTWPAVFTDTASLAGTAEAPFAYSSYLTNAEMRITGEMSGFVNLAVRPKTTIRLATSGVTESWTEVNGGTLVIPAGVTLMASNRVYVGGADAAHVGRLKVEGTINLGCTNVNYTGISASSQGLKANVRGTECGIVEVAAGGVVNGTLGLNQGGNVDNPTSQPGGASQGIYLLKGTATASMESFIGDFRNEYMEIASGGLYNALNFRIGRGSGYANVRVKSGGSFLCAKNGNYLSTAYNGGLTDLLVDGGRISMPNCGLRLAFAENTQAGAYSSFTVCDGGEVRFPTSGNTYSTWINHCKNAVSYLNLLDGGLLESAPLARRTDADGCRCCVSFDGGTYALGNITSSPKCFKDFATGEGAAGDHVFVFAKGATISNDTAASVGFALEMPGGKGIESIALPEEIAGMADGALPGPPMVRITDSTGYGASAVALYDVERRRVTAIKVTSRGVGYTDPTITFMRSNLTAAKSYTGCCTLTDNDTTGGFTKKGGGVLTVDQVCTYTGRTVLAGGTLKLGVDKALRSETEFVLAGGTLDMNGMTLSDGTAAVTDWLADVRLALANGPAEYDSLTFPAGSTVTVLGAAAVMDITDPDVKRVTLIKTKNGVVNKPRIVVEDADELRGWHVSWAGNDLRISRDIGLMLLVR